MPKVSLATLTRYCDRLLPPRQFEDWDGACNGLQVGNRGEVTRLAAAADASLATVRVSGGGFDLDLKPYSVLRVGVARKG